MTETKTLNRIEVVGVTIVITWTVTQFNDVGDKIRSFSESENIRYDADTKYYPNRVKKIVKALADLIATGD